MRRQLGYARKSLYSTNMKISFYYPEVGVAPENKNWMWWVAQGLEQKGHEVILNTCTPDTDLILGMSIACIKEIQRAHFSHRDIPLIVYNWDMHPLLQPLVGKWNEIGWDMLMENALEVWTQTDYHKQLAEGLSGVKHYTMPICCLDFEFENIKTKQGDYAMMASRRVPYKQFDLFENACRNAGVRFISRHPDLDNRAQYVELLANCRVLVIASEEEANTPMSGYEAAFCKKPILLSDIDAHVEEWGDNAIYFQNKTLDSLTEKLVDVFDGKYDDAGLRAYKHADRHYRLQHFVDRIDIRIKELL